MPNFQKGGLNDGIKDYQTIPFKAEFDRKPLLQAQFSLNETTLAARLSVQGQGTFAHFAVLTKQMNEILPLSVPGEISNKDRQKNELIKTAYHRTQRPRAAPSEEMTQGWSQVLPNNSVQGRIR